jgi:hypothetical protein
MTGGFGEWGRSVWSVLGAGLGLMAAEMKSVLLVGEKNILKGVIADNGTNSAVCSPSGESDGSSDSPEISRITDREIYAIVKKNLP